MPQSIQIRPFVIINSVILLAALLFCPACEKKESSEKEITEEQMVQYEELLVDSSRVTEVAAVDYAEIMETVFQLEDSIMHNPAEIPIRSALVEVAYDSDREKIYAVGHGIPDTSITSESRALKTAERAALVDAQRWALFIMRWKENPESPAITERVTGDVPPGTPVQKAVWPGNKVYMLVEFSL